MRVALVSENYYPDVGGVPEHLHNLGAQLARRGHHVSLLTTCYPEEGGASLFVPPPPGVEVLRLGRTSGPVLSNGSVARAAVGLGLGQELAALFRRRCFDVIHVHGPLFPVLPLLAICHAPPASALIGTLHTHFDRSRLLRLLRRPLQRYLDALDGIIAVSESAARSLAALGLVHRAHLVENGVDLDYWQSGRRLPEFSDGKLGLLVQARLEPRNQVGLVIEALGRLRAGTARLLVVGDGPLRQDLARRVPPTLAGAVRFLGTRIADRPDLAKSADIYCFTATIASHPVSLLEGMAAGLPVLCHDIEGTRQLVQDNVEGLFVPQGDVGACARAIERLAADQALRRRMGAAGRRRAAAFSWPDIARRVEAVYEETLSLKKAPDGARRGYEERMRRMSSRMRLDPPPSR